MLCHLSIPSLIKYWADGFGYAFSSQLVTSSTSNLIVLGVYWEAVMLVFGPSTWATGYASPGRTCATMHYVYPRDESGKC